MRQWIVAKQSNRSRTDERGKSPEKGHCELSSLLQTTCVRKSKKNPAVPAIGTVLALPINAIRDLVASPKTLFAL
jgi:hypothetical protein